MKLSDKIGIAFVTLIPLLIGVAMIFDHLHVLDQKVEVLQDSAHNSNMDLRELSTAMNDVESQLEKLANPNIFQTGSTPSFGSVNAVGGISYYLYGSGVGTSDVTVTLTSFKMPTSAYKLKMTDFGTIGYLTLEPGNTLRQEFISFTGVTQNSDGTATLSGVTRGLAPVSPYTASSTLQKAHAGGTVAVISNPPQLYNLFANKNNAESIYGVWTLSSTSLPKLDYNPSASTWTGLASTSFATKGYVDDVNNTGASNASETTNGISELATGVEAASSTISGGTGARLVLPASLATSSPYATATTSIVMTRLDGRISPLFIATSSAETYTWAASTTFSGSFFVLSTSTFSGLSFFNATSTFATSTPTINFKPQFFIIAADTFTAGTTPQPYYIASSTNTNAGKALRSDADAVDAEKFDGFAMSNAVSGGNVLVQTSGVVSGFSALTAGADYYVQNAVGTIGTAIGTSEEYVGVAISATQILMPHDERGDQYLGSQVLNAGSSNVISQPLWRKALVSCQDTASGGVSTTFNITVYKTGATSMSNSDTQNIGATITASCSLGVSATTISPSVSNSAGSITAYYYR